MSVKKQKQIAKKPAKAQPKRTKSVAKVANTKKPQAGSKKSAPQKKASVAVKKTTAKVAKQSSKPTQKKPAPKAKVVAKKPQAKAPVKKSNAKPAPQKSVKTPAKKEQKKSVPQKSAKVVLAKKTPAKVEKKASAPQKKAPTKSIAKPAGKPAPTQKQVSATTSKTEAKKATAKVVAQKVQEKIKKQASSKVEREDAPLAGLIEKSDRAQTGKHSKRPSDSIYFSLKDLDDFFADRANGVSLRESASRREKHIPSKKSANKASTLQKKAPAVPPQRKAEKFAAASIADILGFDPVVAPTREKHDEKEIPRKWKKYYSELIAMRKKYAEGVTERSEEVMKRSVKEDSGDLSSYGEHLADAGSESYDRDMAYSLLSSDHGIIQEIDAAIERMKNGTYGICEYTGEPIPESRLISIPYTRYTKEGQERKELEKKRAQSMERSSFADLRSDSSTEDSSDA